MSHTPFRHALARHPIRTLVASIFGSTALTLVPTFAQANPQGGQVVAGSATISRPNPVSVAVTQASQKAVINWNSFSIGAGEQTVFAQPNAQAIALNRVVGVDPSQIMGALKANGQVWLVNPNGIAFGKTAQVDVGGLLATTLDISNRDFMAGRYKFTSPANTGAMVVNAGGITVNDTGLAALVAPGVENSGVITARLGKIQLASASGFTVDLNGDGTFNFLLDKQVAQQIVGADGTTPSATIANTGSLIADGGTILLTADAAKSVVDHTIDMAGYARARSVNVQGGTIILDGGTEGTVQVSGTLDASAQGPGQSGGTIKVLGGMQDGTVNVTGTLNASAPNGGDGGFIETSAAHVQVAGSAAITTAAPLGTTGTWLIDPHDYTIASAGGDITGTALSTQLASNNVAIISSSGATGTSGDVNVNDAVSWNANTLTLTAAKNVNVNAVMTATGNASLALNPATANGTDAAVAGTVVTGRNSSGNFIGRVDFRGTGTLSIGGTPYVVINSLGVAGDTGSTTLQGMQNNLTGQYALGSNIDATATSTWNSGAGFSPIGAVNQFAGVFDGLGHTISNLYINTSLGHAGLFGQVGVTALGIFGTVGRTGVIRNVGLIGGSVTATTAGAPVGGLIGSSSYGTIKNTYMTGTVTGTGNSFIGGLIGRDSFGTISDSYATGAVGGVGNGAVVGGLVGGLYGAVSNSYATGAVSSSNTALIGGLAGWNNGGTISNAYATGSVTGGGAASDGSGGSTVGGLVASNSGAISKSYASGPVSGGGNGGGLVGINNAAGISTPAGSISQSYATGAVSGNSFYGYGGLVGTNQGTITQSYAMGSVSGTFATVSVGALVGANYSSIFESYATGAVLQGGLVGGLLGYNSPSLTTVSNAYWDINTTGRSTSAAGSGLTSAQLKGGLPSGFSSTVWAISPSINNGYSYLLALGGGVTLIPVTWIVADASGTYGTLANLGAITLSGVSSSDSSSLFGTLGLFSGATAVPLSATTPAGTYSEKVTGLTGSAAGNYSLATSGNTIGSLVIAPKPLTWTVADATSTYGTLPTLGTATLSGIVGSDAVSGIAGAFSGSSPVTLSTSTPVGSYTENVTGLSGAVASNYSLASTGNTPGTLTVSAAAPEPTPTPTPTPISAPGSGSGSNTPMTPAQITVSSAAQTTVLNQSNNSSPAVNVAHTTPSYVSPKGLTTAEIAVIESLGTRLLTELSRLPKFAASNAVVSATSKIIDFFAVNILTKLSLPSANLVDLQNFMTKDIQKSFEDVTPGALTVKVVGGIVSKLLQHAVEQGLTSKGYSENSNVVVVTKFWTDLVVKSTIAGTTSGPAGPVAAIASAAETATSKIIKMAITVNASLNQNLSDIDWNIATNLNQQQQLVLKLQEAQGANNPNLIAHYEAGLKSATEGLKMMYSAKQNIPAVHIPWQWSRGQ